MEKKNWTCVGLSKRQICFLEDISKNCRFSGGRKLRRTSIIRAFLKAGSKLDIDVSNVKSERELKERFIVSFR
jgi:hypothetical protein